MPEELERALTDEQIRDEARNQRDEELRERLEAALSFWEDEYKRIDEGPPGDFDVSERRRAQGAIELCQRFRGSFDSIFEKTEEICTHDWVDATNEVISRTELCLKCGAIRPTEADNA